MTRPAPAPSSLFRSPVAVVDGNTPCPDDWLDANGHMRLMPSTEIDQWSHQSRILWCNKNARYGLVTVELVEWLKTIIGGRSAIEIGAGHGDLCHHLGIQGTDSFVQRDNETAKSMMAAMNVAAAARTGSAVGTVAMEYGDNVTKAEAYAAVRAIKPQVVIASWVTEYWPPDKAPKPGVPANIFGVKEDKIVPKVEAYVLIGNYAVHQHKRILKQPHQTYTAAELPWLRSRATNPEMDCIWVWGR